MRIEHKHLLKLLAAALLAALIVSYFLVVVFLMFGPLYVGERLAVEQSGKLTLLITPVVGAIVYLVLLRWDRRRRIHGR